MSRYNRHIILSDVGAKGQQLISKAKVLVVGAGGLGCPVLQYLTAAGVGQIGIIDFDIVETSNLQRQILFGTASLGKNWHWVPRWLMYVVLATIVGFHFGGLKNGFIYFQF